MGGEKVLHNLKCVNESIISSPCHPFGVCYRRQPILVECQMCDALECARDIDGTVQILRQEPELSVFRANANADIGGKKKIQISIYQPMIAQMRSITTLVTEICNVMEAGYCSK